MRTVLINRKKSFVGAAMKVYVYRYAQDGDVFIKELPYKQVGIIKNGTSLELEISEEAERLHLCYWKSINFHPLICDFQPGNENIAINIKPKFNPFKGNPLTLCEDK